MTPLWRVVNGLLIGWFLASIGVMFVLLVFLSLKASPNPLSGLSSSMTIHSALLGELDDGSKRIAAWVTTSGGGAAGWVSEQILVLGTDLDIDGSSGPARIHAEVAAQLDYVEMIRYRWHGGALEIGGSGLKPNSTDFVRNRLESVGVNVRLVQDW